MTPEDKMVVIGEPVSKSRKSNELKGNIQTHGCYCWCSDHSGVQFG